MNPTPSTTSLPSEILVVEDEPAISDIVATALRFQGHRVTQIDHGRDGFDEAMSNSYDLLVVDVMLPGMDGFEICRQLRQADRNAPVLFLTARDAADDRVQGFKTGGDDYLTKPFSVEELTLRVDAILRRTGMATSTEILRVGDLTVDLAGQEVRRAGEPVQLSATEFRLLEYLCINQNVVLSKAQILAYVWDEDFDGSENVVELYIGYLRRKIDDEHSPLIHTKRGAGYVMREHRP